MVVEGLVRGVRGHRASGGRAGDHAETLGELLDVGFGATVQVVDGPVGRYELELAGVPVLVVESRGPVVGLVLLDIDGRASALAERIEIVGRSKFAAAHYTMNVLAITGGPSEVAQQKHTIVLTDATPLGETRGSIRAVSKLPESMRQLALALWVNKTERSVRVERSFGDMSGRGLRNRVKGVNERYGTKGMR